MKTIFKMINQTKKDSLSLTKEYQFFAKNSRVLSKFEGYYKLRGHDEKTFRIIQSNILIKSLINKEKIEEVVSLNPNITCDELDKILMSFNAPYFVNERNKIFLPIYSRGLNFIYLEEPSKLLEYPYNELKDDIVSSCIDLFDQYNLQLFDSSFTNLIKIGEDKTTGAFYHKEFETIYIINNQGRLDFTIHLFDKNMKRKIYDDIEERLKNVISCFYKGERDIFIKALFLNKFISSKRYKYLVNKNRKRG